MRDGAGAWYVLGAPVSERWPIETSQQVVRVLYAGTTGGSVFAFPMTFSPPRARPEALGRSKCRMPRP
jgi:hypothetical protein